jgi:hypothetical protein
MRPVAADPPSSTAAENVDRLARVTAPLSARPDARRVTWRSLLLGTAAVVAVAALSPYNDYALSNTSAVAGFLPLAAVVILFVLIVAINAPLHRWAPSRALSPAELAVILLMVLVACGLTNWGLMRFFIPQPVVPFHIGATDPAFWKSFLALDLPAWLFPVSSVHDGRSDPVATWFYFHVPRGEATPWRAWIRPLIAWGIFALAMLATLAAMARLVLDQWMDNERLPFPLVQVQAALIEPPRPGKALNDLFRSPWLWVGLGGVFFIHSLSALSTYQPRYFPKVSVGYNFTGIFADPPWFYLDEKVKRAAVSFIVVGVTYFIRSRVAFSLWAIYLLVNAVQMQQHNEIAPAAWADQHLGACIAFVLGIFWIGRHHWARIARGASHRTSFFFALIGIVIMLAWLTVVGVRLHMSVMIIAFILAAHLVVCRVVAETGLPFYRTTILVSQAYSNLPLRWFTGRDIYFAGVFSLLGPVTSRDSLMNFTMHGLGVAREAGVDDSPPQRRKIGGAIASAIVLAFVVSAATTLYCQYAYPTPTQLDAVPVRNFFGADYAPRRDMVNPFNNFNQGQFTPRSHNPALHLGIGFGATALLEIGALWFANWPLLPVGIVACFGNPIGNAWFSILVGWLAKVLIVRFGGARLFDRARPMFIGLIFGEALAAGFWLIVNAIVVFGGGNSQSVKFLL